MYCHLYLRKETIFIPTKGLVHKGLYRDIEPVSVVAASNADSIRQALQTTIARGNPPTPRYQRGAYPRPVVLKYAGLKSWSAFARGTLNWAIKEDDGNYQIVGHYMHRAGWAEDPEQVTNFPPSATVDDVIDRVIAIVQEADGSST